MANINKIRLSGTTYNIQDQNAQPLLTAGQGITIENNVISATGGGSITVDTALDSGSTNPVENRVIYNKIDEVEEVTAAGLNALNDKINPTVELTQAQYNALVSGGTVDPNTFYIITDATAGDLTAIENRLSEDEEVTAAGLNALNDELTRKQDTLVSGTNIKTINNESILGSGNIDIQGGSTYTAGRGISIANDVISFSLPISAGTGTNSVIEGYANNKASGDYSHAEGLSTSATSMYSHAEGYQTLASGQYAHAEGLSTTAQTYCHSEGYQTNANSYYSHTEGYQTVANGSASHVEGGNTSTSNSYEHASGRYNVSNKANTTFGNSGNTLFSVGNGTSSARHNAFEIRQNGDIYITSGGTDIKLQDNLGGGSSYTAGDGIDITNDVISVTGKADTSAVTAIQDSLSGYATTDTEQIISGRKIFTYSNTNAKAIEFKQTDDTTKLGFRVRTSAATNNELAAFEFRPDTYTDSSSVKHPLLYLGHYRNNSTANAGVAQTMFGFRQYDQSGGAAYHYLMPLPAEAKTPFSLTTSYKNYFAPLGFKNGSTMITADNTGVVDLSSELGGLKLMKISQTDYDNLQVKDQNTLYIIVN